MFLSTSKLVPFAKISQLFNCHCFIQVYSATMVDEIDLSPFLAQSPPFHEIIEIRNNENRPTRIQCRNCVCLCLAVGLGHSQSLPSHMVLGGQCQSLSNSQTFVIIAQREAFLSTLSSIANIRHNSLAQHFFSHQSIHPHVVHALGHWKRAKNEAKCNFWRNALSF